MNHYCTPEDQGRGSIKRDQEGHIVDEKLISVAMEGRGDQDYMDTVTAVKEGLTFETLQPRHPAKAYRKLYKDLTIYRGCVNIGGS